MADVKTSAISFNTKLGGVTLWKVAYLKISKI